MYEKRFGLHRKPFQSVLSDHDFYQSETFREILPGVLHALRSDLGVAVLTGPAGVGKSVTLEAMRRTLEADCQAILIRGGTVRSAADLLFMLHRKLVKCQPAGKSGEGAESNDTVRRWEVVERLQRVAEFWGPLVVLLDDAHLIEAEVFAELRALLEEEVDGQKLLRLLITGPLILEEVLAEPNHSDFSQKIRTHVFLQPLRSSEAVEYLSHNITNAGGELSVVMDGPAIERIVAAADGVPRCLNLLADESLIVGEELATGRVTRKIVDKALARLQHLPYTWNVSLYEDSDDDEEFLDEPGDHVAADAASQRSGSINETKSDSVIEIGGPVSAAEPASGVVEIGSSDVTAQSNSGVVEIGGPAVVSQAVSAVASSIVAEERPGVFEIGAPAAPPAAPLVEVEISDDAQPIQVSDDAPLTSDAVIEIGSSVAQSVDLIESIEVTLDDQSTSDVDADAVREGAVDAEAGVEEFTVEVDPFDASGSDDVDMFSDPDGFVEVAEGGDAEELELEEEEGESDPDRFANEARLSALFADPTPTAEEGEASEAAEHSDADEDSLYEEPSGEEVANIDDSDDAVSVSADLSNESLLTSHETDLPLVADSTESYEYVSDEVLEEAASDIPDEFLDEESPADPEADETEVLEAAADGHEGVALTEFSRWEPAGAWPAKTAVAAPAGVATQATRPEKTPVFDRYTWCELGRSVTASQRQRHASVMVRSSLSIWPPVTDGIAPQDIIPVQPADSQYTDLLMDLSMLVDVTTEEASQDVHALIEELTTNTPTVPRSEFNELDEFYTDRKGLEESIERIQSLLNEDSQQDLPPEFMPQEPEDTTEASAAEDEHEPHSAAGEGDSDWHGGPLVSDTMVPLADAAALEGLAQNADEPWQTLPIDTNSVSGEDRLDPPGSDDSSDLDGSADAQSSDMYLDADASDVDHGVEEDVIQEDDELLSNDRQIGDFVADCEDEQQQAYRPRLLQQARQRVVSASAGRGVLKRAAGAESVSLGSAEQLEEVSELRLAVTEQEAEATGDTEPQAAGSRFGNLFTRLRNLQKRSA